MFREQEEATAKMKALMSGYDSPFMYRGMPLTVFDSNIYVTVDKSRVKVDGYKTDHLNVLPSMKVEGFNMIKSIVLQGTTITEHLSFVRTKDSGYISSGCGKVTDQMNLQQTQKVENQKVSYTYVLRVGGAAFNVASTQELKDAIEFLQDAIKVIEANPMKPAPED